jgi:L-fuconolactonase
MNIDAHQHFWRLSQPFDYSWLDKPENAAIKRDFLPDDLQPHLRATGMSRSVVIQTQHNLDENRWALELADQYPFIAGVVGWIDLASPACEEQLLEMRQHPKFIGVRHRSADESEDFIMRREVVGGLKGLQKHGVPFDLDFHPCHLQHVPTLARQLPGLAMVIDHLARPWIKEQEIFDWLLALRAASAFPNVYCKLSGLVTQADGKEWDAEDLEPYVRAAVDLFGPGRCMFGSDWPVCELAASYEEVHDALIEAMGAVNETDRAAIFGGTAQRFYRLPKEAS